MIFVGDISLPYKNAIEVKDLPSEIKRSEWFGNLEGAIVVDSEKEREKWIVYNDKQAISYLLKEFKFIGFSLANNHIFDTGSFDSTVSFLKDLKVEHVGIGRDIYDASKPLITKINGQDVIVLNYGWEVIQCESASKIRRGVNPLTKEHVIKSFRETKRLYSSHKVVVFFHWNYELESIPLPFERELAKYLIDDGAFGIIGCHPHRIGGFEIHKNRPIIYSLGNWLFLQEYYHGGKIRFPEFCNNEVAFEWNLETNDMKFHFFEYKKKESLLVYSHTEDIESETMSQYTPFRGMDNKEYRKWYRYNHHHRNKGLPIYYWEDNNTVIKIKNGINRFRDTLIYILVNMRLKK